MSKLHPHLSRRTRAAAFGLVLAVAGTVTAAVPSSAEVADDTVFELDRNAVNQTPNPTGHDWSDFVGGGTAGSLATSGIVVDPKGETIFSTGGSKDDLDIPSWRHSSGSVPDKDEITNAYAAAYNVDGDLVTYFGSDRFAQNGSANVGFWFLKNQVPNPLPANGTFGIDHEVHDVLVLSEFTNGGAVSTIEVWEWNPAQASAGGNGVLKKLFPTGAATTADCTVAGHSPLACATVNAAGISAPWPYTPKQGPAGTIPKGGFFEGGVNLSELLGTTPCFSSFLAETRSSPSLDATLKDFVSGSFPLCSANISIGDSDTNAIGEQHTFTVTVNKVVAGTSSPVSGNHPAVTLSDSPDVGADLHVLVNTCDSVDTDGAGPDTGAGTNASGQCVVTFYSDKATVVTGSATSSVDLGGGTTVAVATGTASSPNAVKTFVDGTLRWLKHDHQGTLLGGATFWVCQTTGYDSSTNPDTYPPIADTNPDPGKDNDSRCIVVADNGSADDDPTAGEFQIDDVFLGTYTIQEKAAPSGYQLDPDEVTVNVAFDSPGTAEINESIGQPASAFVNIPLYKVIVLTCTTTGELVDSTVDEDPNTAGGQKATITDAPEGLTEAELCGLGGASYDNRAPATYDYAVEVPDEAPLLP
ncbi:prealbumin-like fold domain-containing protein [Nocardioides cavernaquae]|uniref:SpaA-like prealbumin fold domain-containing protein n=1 Tax=Nocardioides cavernaquae TaxID=2321396 RepID=A0A3A5H8V6_9ACTN|nr:prealbumin-like fold domain-containing protein [Nocardioides cavernaquae]RJS47036.1 hypothetical protein D4739_12965 [Nocardioides cavernaquae]